jgi:ADP-ribose pyrophosphatase YjhB (NUDIX family)
MKSIDRFILATILVGLIVNLGSTFIDEYFPQITTYAAITLGFAVAIWGLYRLVSTLLQYVRYGRYAVLIFFLNSENKLLLIKHPFHGCLLPPGGRLKQWELPHVAVAKRLKEETKIEDFEFHPQFHNPNLMISEIVESVPRPYSVHMEHRKQRGLVRFHYAFVYVCHFIGSDMPLQPVEDYQPRWLSLPEIYQLPKGVIPYDDIIRRYEDILTHLNSKYQPIVYEDQEGHPK